MRKKVMAAVLTAAMVASVSAMPQMVAAADDEFKIGLITDVGGVNDGSFNQSAWEGLEKAGEELGVEVNYLESATDADYQPNMETFVDEDYDLIISVGYMLADATREAAEANPDTKFAIIDDSSIDLPNVTSLMFKAEQASYLVGYVAGLTTKTNNIGFVVGMTNETMNQFGYGYCAGAIDANPDITVQQFNANSFADSATGKTMANTAITNGADIVFQAAGATGLGVIEACQEAGVYAIGVDSDQSSIAPKTVLTSAMKRVDNAVYDAVQELIDDKLEGGVQTFDLAAGGVDIAPSQDLISDDVIKAVDEVKEKIISGDVVIPDNKDDFEAKYGDDRQKAQMAVQQMYKEEGVSMGGGCLWSFIPLLILFPLYYVIREPITYMLHNSRSVSAAIVAFIQASGVDLGKNTYYAQLAAAGNLGEFAEAIKSVTVMAGAKLQDIDFSFLGVDLASIPSFRFWQCEGWSEIGLFLIPVASGALQMLSMFISQKMNNQVATNADGEVDKNAAQVANQTNASMMIMMPLMSLWIGFSMPAAISIYWIAQAVFGTVQDVVLTKHYRKVYDAEDAVRQEKAALRRAEEAEKERQRQLRREQNPDGILADNVSKKKLRQQEKEAAEKAARDYAAKKNPELEKEDKKPLSGIAERPYCRGRAYQADRYGKRGAQKEASSGENEE